jgi:hypothetical protein
MSEHISELQEIFDAAKAFAEKNYAFVDDKRDRSIKIIGTMNQLIELKKMSNIIELTPALKELGVDKVMDALVVYLKQKG